MDSQRDTIWLSQGQMAELFDKDSDTIGLHLKNIYEDKELEESSTAEESSVARQEGKRRVRRNIHFYNLDAIISAGYRVNSKRAVQFRQWATRILREHLTQGWTLSRQRFDSNARELEAALTLVRKTAQSSALQLDSGRGLVDIVSRYAQTFLLLQRYDEGLLSEPKTQAGDELPSVVEACAALAHLKADLLARDEATDLFARERDEGLASILGNLDQSVFDEPAYPSIEARPLICSTL